jgi:anti-sigma factor RsiW
MDQTAQAHSKKKTCEDVRDDLYLFISNELEDDEAKEICAHLFDCKACREALSEHVKLSGALKRSMPGVTLRYYSRNN